MARSSLRHADWPASGPDTGPGRLGLLLAILAALTLVRLAGLKFSVVDLFYDESQYWSWARDPALGYFSKPPLLAWLLAGVRDLCGDDEWCIRSPAPVIYAATALVMFFAGGLLYGGRAGFWAAILAAFTPGVVFSSRIISTDVPMLLCWATALLAYLEILRRPRLRWGLVLGLAVGLGLLSKYAMIYFIPGMLLAALVDRRARAVFGEPALWLGLLIAAAVVAPNIVWNLQHSFATFSHTSGLVFSGPPQLSAARALEFLGSQFAVMGPVVFCVMLLALAGFRSKALIAPDRLMLAFFITPVAAVTVFAVYARAYANWASPSIVAGLLAATAILLRLDRRRWLWASIALGVMLQSCILVTDAVATRLPLSIGGWQNPYYRSLGWRDYALRAQALAARLGVPIIAADNRWTFSTLRYYLRDRPVAVASWDTAGVPSFDFAHPLGGQASEPVLLVTGCYDADRLKPFYDTVEALGVFPDFRDDRTRRFVAFRLGQNRAPVEPLQRCRAPGYEDSRTLTGRG